MIRIWIVLLVVEIHLSLLHESSFLLAVAITANAFALLWITSSYTEPGLRRPSTSSSPSWSNLFRDVPFCDALHWTINALIGIIATPEKLSYLLFSWSICDTWFEILKNLSCFTSHPKYNGLLGGISFSSFLTCSIIFVPCVYNNVERSKIRIWIKWTFFRSLAAITFGNIFSWSNQNLESLDQYQI